MANPWDAPSSPADSDLANTLGLRIRELKADLPKISDCTLPHYFGGSAQANISQAAYPAGATFDKLAPNTDVVVFDSAVLPQGTYKLQAMLQVDNGANTVTLGIMNLTDGAPNTALVEITSTSTTGEQKTSTGITFAAGGASKTYGIKIKVSGGNAWAWGIRLIRTA